VNIFYINRLKTLSIAELPYRIKQFILNQCERVFHSEIPDSLPIKPSRKILQPSLDKTEILPPTINVFDKSFNYDNITSTNWHQDFNSGKSFPIIYSKKINIRKDPTLSAKYIWEINRLQFLIQIVINYQQTKENAELSRFIEINKSWKENNPYLKGINWYSNIEVNLRLITWFLCWELLNADELIDQNKEFGLFVKDYWLPLIYQHCIYSYNNPSKYSSSNNHLIAEYSGLFIAATKWDFKESAKWIRYSQKGLETEILKQHSKNGVNKEEAANYIQFITDFFLLSYIVGENSLLPFSRTYKNQLQQIFNYIHDFLDCKGNCPKYGDEDGGKCFIADFNDKFNNFKSLLTSGAIIFKDPVLKSKSNGFDIKNQLLFGRLGKLIFNAIPNEDSVEGSKFYKEEGHFISRKKEEKREIYLHFDAAPLGYLSIAAHGHADALSFILHVDGHPVFVDPGTYTYHTDPKWRNYFIGTLAHNSIKINKHDQATIAGSTLWLQHYKCNILHSETTSEKDIIRASHTGYEKFGIIHTRELIFDKESAEIKITDTIKTKTQNPYFIEMPFHLHPGIEVKPINENCFSLKNKSGINVQLQTDLKLTAQVIHGQIKPTIVGWYSKSFSQKEPTNTILCSLEISKNIKFETTISMNQK
jgi:hypothetical protein